MRNYSPCRKHAEGMSAFSRLDLAASLARGLQAKEGRNLVAVAVYGSVAQGTEREHSDLDVLLVVREKRRRPWAILEGGVLVTLKQMTMEEAADEAAGAHENLPEALSGWRSMRPLYDPHGFVARLIRRARKPGARQFRESARLALLATFEDYGKLLNAVADGDREEAREMAIWFTNGAMTILFCLQRRVPASGHRLFADMRRSEALGKRICALRYGNHGLRETGRLARGIWGDLLRKARAQRIAIAGLG